MQTTECTRLADGFSPTQKVLLRLLFAALLAVGIYAGFLQGAGWGWFYVGFVVVSQVVLLRVLCGHCPYPHQYDDCLLLPVSLLRRLAPYRGPEISPAGKLAIGLALAGVVVVPQYWLVQRPVLLVMFWAACLPFVVYFPLRLCGRCRHTGCPANRVPRPPVTG